MLAGVLPGILCVKCAMWPEAIGSQACHTPVSSRRRAAEAGITGRPDFAEPAGKTETASCSAVKDARSCKLAMGTWIAAGCNSVLLSAGGTSHTQALSPDRLMTVLLGLLHTKPAKQPQVTGMTETATWAVVYHDNL